MYRCPICDRTSRVTRGRCSECETAFIAGVTDAKRAMARFFLRLGADGARTNGLSDDDIKLATGLRAPGRNEICPCGSGKKAKRCCLKPTKGASDE